MVHVLVRLSVKDQATWKKAFEEASALRKNFTSLGVRAFAKDEDANQIVILGEYENAEKARQLFQSPEFREATQRAGMIGAPEVTFLNEVVKLDA